MDKPMKAIVFAGGGSKGAYQIGAWKALNELGEEFQIATGTSIGSINAAFYVQKDFDEAYRMWGEVTAGDIMKNGINLDVSFEGIFSQRENLMPFLKNYINTKSVDNSPFQEMLQKYFSAEKFFSSEIDFALMTLRFNGYISSETAPVEITKEYMAQYGEDAWKWIGASAACYPVFPPMEIDGKTYIDGGYYDNIPIASALKLGAERVVVVDLKTENNHEGYIKHPRVTYIKPSKDLGAFMNFNREVLDRSIRLGYNDTMKVYGKYLGKDFTFIPSEDSGELLSEASTLFLSLLTASEGGYDFSAKARYSRVNKLEGTTTVIASYLGKEKITEADCFTGAAELFLKAVGYEEEKEYELIPLLYTLKTDVDRLYPLLEFDYERAFATVKEYLKEYSKNKGSDIRKYDEDVLLLIFTSFMRTLQKLKL